MDHASYRSARNAPTHANALQRRPRRAARLVAWLLGPALAASACAGESGSQADSGQPAAGSPSVAGGGAQSSGGRAGAFAAAGAPSFGGASPATAGSGLPVAGTTAGAGGSAAGTPSAPAGSAGTPAAGAAGSRGGSLGSSGAAGSSSNASGASGAFGGTGGTGMGGRSGSAGAAGSGTMPTRSAGCGKATARPDPAVQQTLMVGSATRYYLLVIPNGYDANTPMPLVFGFHGRGMNNVWAAMDNGGLGLKATSKNTAILVYPQGSGDPPGNQCVGCGGASITSMWSPSGADLTFIDQLYADIANKWCVDPTEVFASGFSMGGMMANGLGCNRGELFRGIAAIHGLNSTSNCSTKGTAALIQHDRNDSVVAYSHGEGAAEAFRTLNGCTTSTANAAGYQGCVAYQGCRAGFPVLLCSTTGVDHHVPSHGPANVWAFFSSLMN